MGRLEFVLVALLALVLAFALPRTAWAGAEYAIQVGALGDEASIGNLGVGVEIRTATYGLTIPDIGNVFWVGDYLRNGAFIQFGYMLAVPGVYCSYGEVVAGKTTCLDSAESVGYNDARWFWQYWPNSTVIDFYGGVGSANSVGPDGSWHSYRISPNPAYGWSFILDGQTVSVFNRYGVAKSLDQVHEVAEEVSGSVASSDELGPVEFRNMSYLAEDYVWQPVTSLSAMSRCTFSANCDIPYGVSVVGPNEITVGAGQTPVPNGWLLWPKSFTLRLSAPTGVAVSVDGHRYVSSNDSVALPLQEGMHYIQVQLYFPINSDNRLRFLGWSDGSANPNRTLALSSDTSLQVNYIQQYKVSTISPIFASGDGWYDQGSTAIFSTDPCWRMDAAGLEIFRGWYDAGLLVSASGSDYIQVNRPYQLHAQWTTYPVLPEVEIILSAAAFGCVYKTQPGAVIDGARRILSSQSHGDYLETLENS